MNKATLKASILVDNDGAGNDVYLDICLFKNDENSFEWRNGGELGDVNEQLPTVKNVAQAKKDFLSVYPKNSTWKPKASWI